MLFKLLNEFLHAGAYVDVPCMRVISINCAAEDHACILLVLLFVMPNAKKVRAVNLNFCFTDEVYVSKFKSIVRYVEMNQSDFTCWFPGVVKLCGPFCILPP